MRLIKLTLVGEGKGPIYFNPSRIVSLEQCSDGTLLATENVLHNIVETADAIAEMIEMADDGLECSDEFDLDLNDEE